MKKHLLRLTVFLCILLLSVSLCGCSFWGDLPELFGGLSFGKKEAHNYEQAESEPYELTGITDFYAKPDRNSQIQATYYAGQRVTYSMVVTIEGVTWARADVGWFIIDGNQGNDTEALPEAVPDTAPVTEYVSWDGIVRRAVAAYASPSTDASVNTQLDSGKRVHISETATVDSLFWGLSDHGWILLEDFQRVSSDDFLGYGVIRDSGACYYPEPNVYSGVTNTPSCGTRYEVLAVVNVDGMDWYYTHSGWISTDSMYLEGERGFRACTAMVIDPTPLNVRIAPGTDKEILTTLTYGDYVNILERINYNGSDWGYTGTGWIFMDLTEIQ